MTTIKTPTTLKEKRQMDKEKKNQLKEMRAVRQLNRDLQQMEKDQLKSAAELNEFLNSSLAEVKKALSDATELFKGVINEVDKELSNNTAHSTELAGLLSIFRRDVESLDSTRKALSNRVIDCESTETHNGIRALTVLYEDVLNFAIEIGSLLLPQTARISEVVKQQKSTQ